MRKLQLYSIILFSFLLLSPTLFGAVDVLGANYEDKLLEEFVSDPVNLIPDMIFISEAIVTVDYADLGLTGELHTESFANVETILSAPLIGVSSLEDTDKIGINPLHDENSHETNYGFAELTGSKKYLVENTTDTHYSQLDIIDNYSVEQYHYLLLEKLETYNQTTTSSIIVSFGKTATANISLIAETHNVTVASGVIYPIATNLWYNLACHTNETYSYVINIEIKNIQVNGYFVFQFENNKFVTDSRYNIAYTNADESEVSSNSFEGIQIGDERFVALSGTTNIDLTIQATTLSELNTTKMLSAVSNIDTAQNVYVVARGWKTGNELEDALKAMWRQQLELKAGDRITDYELTKGYFSNIINRGTVKLIQRELRAQLESQTDYNALMNNVRKKYLPICAIANNKDVFESFGTVTPDGFWDTIKEGITSVANTVTGVVKNIFDAPAKTLTALGDSVATIITPVAQTVQTVASVAIPATTNMITDSVGHVTEGVVGVAGAAEDLGSNIMDSLKLPLIIIGSVLGVGLIGVGIWYFGIKPRGK